MFQSRTNTGIAGIASPSMRVYAASAQAPVREAGPKSAPEAVPTVDAEESARTAGRCASRRVAPGMAIGISRKATTIRDLSVPRRAIGTGIPC